jgi:hypothetical protein
MHFCEICNLNFKSIEEFNNHKISKSHSEKCLLSNCIRSNNSLPPLTISSDSLSSLEVGSESFSTIEIRSKLASIKTQLKRLSKDIDKISQLI